MRTMLAITGLTASLMRGPSGTATPQTVIVSFDPTAGEFPEGIAFDSAGAMYVSLALTGEIRRYDDDGSVESFYRFDPGTAGLGVLGLAADRGGTIFVAVPSNAPEAHGVWAIVDGVGRRLEGSEQIPFPNGIAIDERGVLFVTDSIGGSVWRIAPGERAESWFHDVSITGTGALNGPSGPALGANGIAYHRGRLLVTNTDRMQIVEIVVGPSGDPAAHRLCHAFTGALDFLDGIVMDAMGNAYAVVGGRKLVRIDRTGEATVIATDEDGLSVPASLAFGTRGAAKRTIFLTNLSLPPLVALTFGPDAQPMPGVVAVHVSVPGTPMP